MAKGVQARAKDDLHQSGMAESARIAEAAFDVFLVKYGPKYPRASDCLTKDRETLLAFYDFPAAEVRRKVGLARRSSGVCVSGGHDAVE